MPLSEDLTTRQRVRLMLEEGKSVRQIARELDLSTAAVYYHRDRIESGAPNKRPGPPPAGQETAV